MIFYEEDRTDEKQKELIDFLKNKSFYSETGKEYTMSLKNVSGSIFIEFFLDNHFVGHITNFTPVVISDEYMIIGEVGDEDYFYFEKPVKLKPEEIIDKIKDLGYSTRKNGNKWEVYLFWLWRDYKEEDLENLYKKLKKWKK